MISINKYYVFSLFLNRLETQRRKKSKKTKYSFTPDIYASMFKDFIGQRHYSASLLTTEVLNLKIYYKSTAGIKQTVFRDIDGFGMDSRFQLYVIIDNEYYKAMTPTHKQHKDSKDYEEFILPDGDLRYATIDHNPSFSTIIEDKLSEFPVIAEISNATKEYTDGKKTRNLRVNHINENGYHKALWKELECVHKYVKIELVLAKYNKRDS